MVRYDLPEMKKYLAKGLKLLSIVPFLMPAGVSAQIAPPDVLIVEIQVKSAAASNSSNEEFIELFNTTDQPIDISTWTIEYRSATGITWSTKATLHGSLAPDSHYLLASQDYLSDQALDFFSPGLSDTAGHVRLVSPNAADPVNPVVHDLVGWGTTASVAEGGAPALKPPGGSSLQRIMDSDGNFVDTDNNAADFMVSTEPTPEVDPLYTPPPEPDDPPETIEPDEDVDNQDSPEPSQPPEESTADPTPEPVASLLPPQITELLPNPAPPLTDSLDEYVEIYNPNEQAIDLNGYKVQTGNTYAYSYELSSVNLPGHGYLTLTSGNTNLSLANSGGKARLLDSNGVTVSETTAYEDAPEGQAWALEANGWQWTTTPTPGSENTVTRPVVLAKATTSKSKKTTAKKASKPKTAKVKAASATNKSKPKTAAAASEEDQSEPPQIAPLHNGVLAVIGLLTLVYAAYEYRHDALNKLYQFRKFREARRAARG